MLDLTDSHIHAPRLLSDARVSSMAERFRPLWGAASSGSSGERVFGHVLTAVEIVGVGGAMSYLNSRRAAPGRSAIEIAGVPADLALGMLFSGVSVFTGYFGKYADHGLNVGIG